MLKLDIIGLWLSYESLHMCRFPNPSNFIDENWNLNEKSQIISYLDNGYPLMLLTDGVLGLYAFPCRICDALLRKNLLTDGKFIWRLGLSHYLQHHNIRLPNEFEDFALMRMKEQKQLSSHKFKRKSLGLPYLENGNNIKFQIRYESNYDWWIKQDPKINSDNLNSIKIEIIDKARIELLIELLHDLVPPRYFNEDILRNTIINEKHIYVEVFKKKLESIDPEKNDFGIRLEKIN